MTAMTLEPAVKTETNGFHKAAAPARTCFTPAFLERLDVLLDKHAAPSVCKDLRNAVQDIDTQSPLKMRVAISLVFLAGCCVHRRYPQYELGDYFIESNPLASQAARAIRRNERLLVRLVYRGMTLRGEWPLTAAPGTDDFGKEATHANA